MRWIGILAVCLSLSSLGFYFSFLFRKRISTLRLLSEFFSGFDEIASSGAKNTAEALLILISRPQFSRLDFLHCLSDSLSDGCNIKELWLQAVSNAEELRFLHNTSEELLFSFADVLGKGTLREFSEKCRYYSDRFYRLCEREEEKWQKNRSLMPLSGIIAAAFVFLVLI